MATEPYDVTVIGGGPGGYVAAIRAAQLGMRVALVEKAELGGICLNWGCIPSKALIHNADVVRTVQHAADFGIETGEVRADLAKAITRSRGVVDRMVKGVAFLMRKNKIDVHRGAATLRSPTEIAIAPDGTRITTKAVIVAAGARPKQLPGLETDGRIVIGSYEALGLGRVPEQAVVVGAGPVGLEFAYVWSSYGAKVTVVEALPRILPQEDEEISAALQRALGKHGIQFVTGAGVEGIDRHEGGATVRLGGDTPRTLEADAVLVGIGVQGNSDGLGLEELGVAVERSWIVADPQTARTNVPGILAIGDVTGPPLLAHAASAQAVAAVEHLAGRSPAPIDYDAIPRATYCHPEVASVGLTEADARGRGFTVKTGTFPFRPNGRALAMADVEGLVKVVADAATGQILGIHMVGPTVSELLGEAVLARTFEFTPSEIGFAIHAHPALSEVLHEAALAVNGEAIHI